MDFPGGSMGKESTCNAGDTNDGFDPWVGRSPGEGNGQPTPVFLPGKFHGHRSLAGYSPWGCKESDMTEHTRTRAHTHTHTHTSLLSFSVYRFCLPLFITLHLIVVETRSFSPVVSDILNFGTCLCGVVPCISYNLVY